MKFKSGIKHFAESDDYSRIFSSILKIYIPPQNINETPLSDIENSLVTNSGDSNLDLTINEIKFKTLKCLKIIWNYIIKKKPKNLYSTSNSYVQSALTFVHTMNNTLITLAASPRFEAQIQNSHINGIVVNSIEIISSLTNEKDFQFFFS